MEALKLHIIATVVFNLLVSARRVGINAILPYIYSHCSYFLVFCCTLKYIIPPHSSELFHWYSGNHTITSLGPEKQPRIFISQDQFKSRHSHGCVLLNILYLVKQTNLLSQFWQSINTKSMGTWWNIGLVIWLSTHYRNGSLRNTAKREHHNNTNSTEYWQKLHTPMIKDNFYTPIIQHKTI